MAERSPLLAPRLSFLPGQRLFFALWPDNELGCRIDALSRQLQEHGGRPHCPGDLHMTLVFLGNVAPEKAACIQQVADAVRGTPFTLTLNRIDYWPRPRILLLGSDRCPEPLAALVRDLQTGLADCGFKPEKRPYKPHVTLARKARKIAPGTLEEPLEWRVSEFMLAGSSLGPTPPRYQILRRWPLECTGS